MLSAYQLSDEQLLAACRSEKFRAQGPGGQHTNRTDSAVRITHVESGLQAQCQDHREQARNHKEALRRLRLRLALTIRGPTQTTLLAPYKQGTRIIIGANNNNFPQVVGIIFDALVEEKGSLRSVADRLLVSTSQLTKLLTSDKEVHAAANTIRQAHGLGAIHG